MMLHKLSSKVSNIITIRVKKYYLDSRGVISFQLRYNYREIVLFVLDSVSTGHDDKFWA